MTSPAAQAQAKAELLDQEGLAVWNKAVSKAGLASSVNHIPLLPFCESFCDGVQGDVSTVDRKCVAVIFADHGEQEVLNPQVTKRDLALFLLRFGPYQRCLPKVRDVLVEGKVWFHGCQNRTVSEKLLSEAPQAGLFLLRYSSAPGAFTVDYIKSDKISHFNNIRNDPDGGVLVSLGKQGAQQTLKYSNMSTFLIKNKHLFKVPCPNRRSHFAWMKVSIPSTKALEEMRRNAEEMKAEKVDSARKRVPLSAEQAAKVQQRVQDAVREVVSSQGQSLALVAVGLQSPLPAQICGLGKFLQQLDLSSNDLTELPVELGQLRQLRSLVVNDNTLTALPGAMFRGLQMLEQLQCCSNALTRLPDELFAVSTLNYLDVSMNQLAAVPAEMGSLLQLQFLDLSCNQIDALPPQLGALENLEELNLRSNRLVALPASLGDMSSLVFFDVSKNALADVPDAVWDLPAANPRFLFLTADNPVHPTAQARLRTRQHAHSPSISSPNPPPNLTTSSSSTAPSSSSSSSAPLSHNNVHNKNSKSAGGHSKSDSKSDSKADSKADSEGGAIGLKALAASQMRNSMDIVSLLRMQGDEIERGGGGKAGAGAGGGGGGEERDLVRSESAVDVREVPKHAAGSLWGPAVGYEAEEPIGTLEPEQLILRDHIILADYQRFFYNRAVHANIIGNDKFNGDVCISIQKEIVPLTPEEMAECNISDFTSTGRVYRVIMRTKQGDQRFAIPEDMVKVRKKERYARSEDLLSALKKMLKGSAFEIEPKNLYVIRDASSHKEFLTLESKMRSNACKFGVVYGLEGQTETEFYRNCGQSPLFEEFLQLLGDRVQMKGFTNYRGGLGNKIEMESVYTVFQNHEIMFHVSTLLPFMAKTDEEGQQWERKRFIGNDIGIVLFYEGKTPVSPAIFRSNFNHVFILIQPERRGTKTVYHVHVAVKEGVADSLPHVPQDNVFAADKLFRRFLLTKLINSERCAMSAPQFRKPQERVRGELFANLQEKFPKKKATAVKTGKSGDTAVCYLDADEYEALNSQLKKKATSSSATSPSTTGSGSGSASSATK